MSSMYGLTLLSKILRDDSGLGGGGGGGELAVLPICCVFCGGREFESVDARVHGNTPIILLPF